MVVGMKLRIRARLLSSVQSLGLIEMRVLNELQSGDPTDSALESPDDWVRRVGRNGIQSLHFVVR